MIPKAILKEALRQKANVGRCYDSRGKHVAFYLVVSREPYWAVYRAHASGMLALLRQRRRNLPQV